MATFDVYPKKGEKFPLNFDSFELKDGRFILYASDEPNSDGFISFENVAAIVSTTLPQSNPQYISPRDPIKFRVYLKNQENPPIEITADSCQMDKEPSLKFFKQIVEGPPAKVKDIEIEGIYVALSEVVAVMPAEGLQYRPTRHLP